MLGWKRKCSIYQDFVQEGAEWLSVTFLVVWKIREARVNAVLPIVSRFMSFWSVGRGSGCQHLCKPRVPSDREKKSVLFSKWS